MKLRIYNKTLDPNLWDENKQLDPEVADILLKIANDFYGNTDLKGDIQDILFLGSSANYSWTPASDIDLHVVIDVSEQNITPDYARKFMDSLAAKWNNDHKIEVRGHPVEVYLQDLSEPNSSPELARKGTAIYSLIDKKWLLPPVQETPQIDQDKIQKKFAKLAGQINTLIQTEDITKLKDLMKSIRNYRNAGLAKGGEFSTENIVFKALRRTGWLTKLKNTINTLYDRGVSLNEAMLKKSVPFLLIGVVNSKDLHVGAVVDYVGEGHYDYDTEEGDPPQYHDTHFSIGGDNKRWRYKSQDHTVYWMSEEYPEEMEKDAVFDYLHNKFNIINPRNVISNNRYHLDAHRIDEVVDIDRYLIFGVTNGELHTIAKKFWQSGGDDRHEKLMKEHPDFSRRDYDSLIHWIYKKKNNIFYYYGSPTADQRYVMLAFLEDEYGVKNPIVLKMVTWSMEPYTV